MHQPIIIGDVFDLQPSEIHKPLELYLRLVKLHAVLAALVRMYVCTFHAMSQNEFFRSANFYAYKWKIELNGNKLKYLYFIFVK